MSKWLRKFVSLAALACIGTFAQADVLTFEDLPSGGPAFFTSNYHGFMFGTNDVSTTAWFYSDEVIPGFYTPQSPTHYIATDFQLYNGDPFEATQPISSAVDFVFNGAYFSGFGQIRYQLYNDNMLVFTSTDSAALSDSNPIFVASGYSGAVDAVVVVGMQGYYALDNFTFNEAATVPEPGSLALVALAGLMGVVVMRRRRIHS